MAKNLFFILLLFLWLFILRVPTFLNSAIGWDESLYLIMADHWLSGNLPYSTVWDHKPIGIYLIFYIAMSLFGRSVLAMRLIAILFIFAASLALFFIASQLFRSRKTGMMAAIMYPVFSLALEGLESNTEIFFICFNLMALSLLLYAHQIRGHWARFYPTLFTAGLFFGCALQIKYLVVFEVLFFLFLFFIIDNKQKMSLKVKPIRKIQEWSLMTVTVGSGLIAPSLLVMLYFWVNDSFDSFFYANFEANFYHLDVPSFSYATRKFISGTFDWVVWILIISMWFLIDGYRRNKIKWPKNLSFINRREIFSFLQKLNRVQIFLFLWIFVGLFEACFTRKFYDHYYLVTIPPLCLLLAQELMKRQTKPLSDTKLITSSLKVVIIPIIFIFIFDYSAWLYERVQYNGTEKIVQISEYINDHISETDYIYAVNKKPILYFLTKARLPTRYPFPLHVLLPHFNQVSNLDREFEVNRILNLRPKFVLIWDDHEAPPVEDIRDIVEKQYTIDRVYDDVTVYKITSHED